MVHVARWKVDKVEYLTDMLVSNPVVGIVDISGIPSSQLQQIRRSLPSRSRFVVAKNTLIKLALKKASKQKKNIEKLLDTVDGQRGIIAADINPFRLFRTMESTKIKAPARGGELAPLDIVVKEGETPFKPGPIVGELQKAGFPAAIERGRVIIKKDKTMVKEGERIPSDVAKLLTKLDIYPMTVGLSLLAGFEAGTVFMRDVLDVDIASYIKNMGMASSQAFNLAMFVGYPTKPTIRALLQNAHQNAFNLAFNSEIPTPKVMVMLLSKAQIKALSLASHLPDLVGGDEKKEGVEEPMEEGKKEERPKEEKEEAGKPRQKVEKEKERAEKPVKKMRKFIKKKKGVEKPKEKVEKQTEEVKEPKEKKEEPPSSDE